MLNTTSRLTKDIAMSPFLLYLHPKAGAEASKPYGKYRRKEDSGDSDYETPWSTFRCFDNFTYHRYGKRYQRDVCADPTNTKCRKFWTEQDNCLLKAWSPADGPFFCNPPYARPKTPGVGRRSGLYPFIEKAFIASQNGAFVGCFVPSWTGDLWQHKFLRRADLIYLQGTVTFRSPKRLGQDNPAGFSSMFIIFHPDPAPSIRFVKWPTQD
jgi:hypothetical protein